jgi:sugar/nucleoside kinase (ribokinase family)
MKRILVIGELNADLILSGLPSLPLLGRELLGTGFATVLGSSSAITAARLAALGADDLEYAVDFAGWVGDDQMGRFVLDQLHHFGVHTEAVQIVDTPTGVTISLTYAHDRSLLTYPGAMSVFDGAAIGAEMLARYEHVHVGSFFLQPALQSNLAQIFQMAREQGVTTSLDVGWDPWEKWMRNAHLADVLAHTDGFLPNEDEATSLAADVGILKQKVSGTLFVKQGRRGASAYIRGEDGVITEFHTPSFMVNPIDTTGAGDAFNAGLIYGRYIRGETVESAMRFAVACGAEATLHIGGATAAPTEQIMRAWITQQEDTT